MKIIFALPFCLLPVTLFTQDVSFSKVGKDLYSDWIREAKRKLNLF